MSSFFLSSAVFVLGLIVGSFLNCVIYRLEQGSSFLKGRSFCPLCKHTLSWRDLIPVLSFLMLKGKCRYCHQKISWQYPLVELATGLLFLFIVQTQLTWNMEQLTIFDVLYFCYLLIIICFLIIIFVYDFKHYLIPDKVIYPAILISGIWLVYERQGMINTAYAAFGAALFFLIIVLISRGKWMGVGDIKLAFLMGLFLGWPAILVALLSAFYLGALVGICLIMSGRKSLRSEVPFGPFLVTGTFLAMFFGEKLVDWYLALFLIK